jgi:hypothetical protein
MEAPKLYIAPKTKPLNQALLKQEKKKLLEKDMKVIKRRELKKKLKKFK